MFNIRRVKYFLRSFASPESMVVAGFAIAIGIGAVLLYAPWSRGASQVSFIDALFTSTSAVCVTGLTVLDTGKDFSFFGQVVIALLIQTGGLGIMTFAALTFQILGLRFSLQSSAVLHDTFFQKDIGSRFQHAFWTILALTFAIEGLGMIFLILFFAPRLDSFADVVFYSFFHSVSAFCNAGFSLASENIVLWRDSEGIMIIIMLLIIAGGLGYSVLYELFLRIASKARSNLTESPIKFSLHSRVVLFVSALLIVSGTALIMLFGQTSDEKTLWEKLMNALFQSVSARTAGFNSVDIGRMPSASLLIIIILMFIGGSPGSCAGGIKTSSMAIYWARLVSGLRGRKEVHLHDRRLPSELVARTDLLVTVAIIWNILGVLALLTTESDLKVDSIALVFEQVSAFGTVGLSTGLTAKLSTPGKLWIILTMFIGRLGPLTLVMLMIPKSTSNVRYPKGTVMIG